MDVGIVLPSAGSRCTPENIVAVAGWAQALGYDGVWVTDHVILPERVESQYPYRPHGRWEAPSDTPWMDPLLSLSWAARAAPHLTLGTSVMVAPLRNPVLLAKQISTLDFLSGGRVILGLGVGWMREEFELIGTGYDDRSRRALEMVELMRALWTGESVDFRGRFFQVSGARMHPTPARGRVPIVWGGHSDHALARVAAAGDGWHPTQISLDDLRAGIDTLRRYCDRHGRSMADVMIIARPGNAYPVTRETLAALRAMGVTHLVVDAPSATPDVEGLRREMERVAEVCELRPR